MQTAETLPLSELQFLPDLGLGGRGGVGLLSDCHLSGEPLKPLSAWPCLQLGWNSVNASSQVTSRSDIPGAFPGPGSQSLAWRIGKSQFRAVVTEPRGSSRERPKGTFGPVVTGLDSSAGLKSLGVLR